MKNLFLISLSALMFVACSSGWSEEEKKKYLDACNAGGPNFKNYCDCTLEKVMKEAPDPKDADKVDIMKIAKECMGELN